MSSACPSIFPLEYQEAGRDNLALPSLSRPIVEEPMTPVAIGVPEDEVERRIQVARTAAIKAAEQQLQVERDLAIQGAQEKIAVAIAEFASERIEYFRRVEGEVVQLALSIARKILQREANLDPTFLAALVRIAIDKMQSGSTVRIRVAPGNVRFWQKCAEDNADSQRWQIVADETLDSGDCIVETEVGTANFGFESQLRDIEESFAQLLAHRPGGRLHDAEAA